MKSTVWIFILFTTTVLSTTVCAQVSKTTASRSQPMTTNTQPSTELSNQLDIWLKENLDEDAYKALQILPATVSQIAQMLDFQSKTESQIESLENQMRTNELAVQEKKRKLSEIQQKIDFLKLTTNQIATIEKYNHSLDRDPHFSEWLTERGTWFDISKDIILSAAFLIIGIFVESARQKRKRRFLT